MNALRHIALLCILRYIALMDLAGDALDRYTNSPDLFDGSMGEGRH